MNKTKSNYVTLLQAERVGKIFFIDSNGEVGKTTTQPKEYSAFVVEVKTAKALRKLLKRVSESVHECIMFGYPPDIGPNEEFTILSSEEFIKLSGYEKSEGWYEKDGKRCITREKHNIQPSSWAYFDYDTYSDTPKKFRYDSPVKWWAKICERAPELEGPEVLFSLSGSSRIVFPSGEPYKAENCHAFVQIEDANDVERYGNALFIHFTNNKKFTFTHKISSGVKVPRTIFDKSTLQIGRMCYDGKPYIQGDKLTVKPAEFSIAGKGKVNTKSLVMPNKSSYRLNYVNNREHGSHILCQDLTPELKVELEDGSFITIKKYRKSKKGKLRCQSPFRPDSRSMAGVLNKHRNGNVFLWDEGTKIKHEEKRKKVIGSYSEECLSNRTEKPLEYLWHNRICKKTITTIAGDPGTGKSTMMAEIVSHITNGEDWADGHPVTEVGAVLWLNGEDPIDEVLIPRLNAVNADLSKVVAMKPRVPENAVTRGFSFAKDIEEVRNRLSSRDDYKLFIVDPISAFLDGSDSHNMAEMRNILATITELCIEFEISAIIVTHFKKDWSGLIADAINGSSAFHAASRIIIGIVPDPENDSEILFGNVKNNHQKKDEAKTLIYKIDEVKRKDLSETSSYGRVTWNGESKINIRKIRGADYSKKKTPAKHDLLVRVTKINDGLSPVFNHII